MFKNLKKKFAKVALLALALQLAFLGLGGGVTAAHADVQEDVTAPTANVVHYQDANTIVYTFSEKVKLTDNDGLDVTGPIANKLAIYKIVADNYGLSTKMKNKILSADLVSGDLVNALTIKYDGSLVQKDTTSYIVDAWGYRITDLAGNKLVLDPEYQVFTVVGDNIPPKATVTHDETTKTITYNFSEPVQLMDAEGETVLDSSTYAASLAIYDRDTYLAHVLGQPAPAKATGVDIASAVLSSDAQSLVITYTGSLVKNVDSYYVVDAWGKNITDLVGNKMLLDPSQVISVTGDSVKAVVIMASKPVIVSDTKKTIEVTFTGNEAISLKEGTKVVFTQGTKIYSGAPSNAQTNPTKLVVYTPANFFDGGVTPIDVTATFTDLAGNETLFAGQIKVDTIAPAAVTGITTLVNPDGSVTLSWVNPPVGTYSGLRIVRVGDFTVSVSATVASYTDNTTEKGKTYEYSIVAFDEAGNETATAPVSVSVPAPVVAAAVSDTVAPAPTNTNTDTEVKANVTDDNAKKDDSTGFPVWGIILLVLLALVGGYLIWNQKPTPVVAPIVETKKKTTNTKKK